MKIPKTIQIGDRSYTVKYGKDNLEIYTKYKFRGTLNHNRMELVINEKESKKNQEQIFLHEVVHGILRQMGMTELNKDEKFVHLFCTHLYKIINKL